MKTLFANIWKGLNGFALSAIILVGTLPLCVANTGCTVSVAQIKADGAAVAQAVSSIAAIEQATDPALAAKLTDAANALLAITNNWTTGSSVALFNDAANAVEVVLALVPQTAAIAPLIPIAVAAIDILIANINPAQASLVKAKASYNPYRGKVVINHRFGRSVEGDFKATWNGVVKLYPALSSAKLK
jgi:hypothetical protein